MVRWWTTKEKNFCTYLAILNVVPGTFWDWIQQQKTNLGFQKIFDKPLANHLISKSFLNAMAIFLAIYQSHSKYSRLVLQKKSFEPEWYTWLSFGTQPLPKALGDLWII